MSLEGSTALVHVVDDDHGLREALARLVRSVGYDVCLHSCVKDFLDTSQSDIPSCLLLDVRLPDMSGLDLQASLALRGIDAPVIIMTGYADIAMSVKAMKLGAVDFLMKPFRDQDLLDAIAKAMEKDRLRLQESLARVEVEASYARLTDREREVLACILDGLMNKEIAERLGLSIVTVKAHRGAMTRKMGARNVAELVRMGRLIGLENEGI